MYEKIRRDLRPHAVARKEDIVGENESVPSLSLYTVLSVLFGGEKLATGKVSNSENEWDPWVEEESIYRGVSGQEDPRR